MSDEPKPVHDLLELARKHVAFLKQSARADASEAGMRTTLQEAECWEAAIKKASER
jgi:hypothetical protein